MADVLRTNNFDRGYKKSGKNNEIEYYEERLSKRREKEREEKKLNEFLNNSLRSSDRLKALEKNKRINYKINDAYLDEGWEDDIAIDVERLTDGLCNRKNMKTALSASDLEWLQRYVRKDVFKNSYDTCMTLSEILRKYECPPLVGSTEALANVKGVREHIDTCLHRLKDSQYKYQMQELLQILSSPEIRTFCDANDRCAQIADKNNRYRKENNKTEPRVLGVSVDVQRPSKNGGVRDQEEEVKSPRAKSQSPQETMRIIKSQLKGCYAQLYSSQNGSPLKTVVLEKGNQPLGATVRNEKDAVVVGRIVVGGVAHKSGLLKEGDELLSVNGMELTGKDVNEVSDILARMTGTLRFTVASCDDSTMTLTAQPGQTTMIHLRSLFTYNPEDDMYIPCKDIGLGFERGDILYVTNIQDPNWWQAYKDADGDGNGSLGELAGLIPSLEYQYKREALKKQLGDNKDSMDPYASTRGESSILCMKKHKKNQPASISGGWVYNVDLNGRSSDGAVAGRKRKHTKKSSRSTYCPGDMELNQPDPDINTYETVAMYLPQPRRKRPIVLVGTDLIGRLDLAKKIVDTDPEQFSLIKQHTTLDTKSGDYRQVTKDEFKHFQNMDEFIETAVFEKNWYGISKSELKSVIDAGKTAVLVLQPESLAAIRKTNHIPYVIFVCPPTKIEVLRALRLAIDNQRPPDDELFFIMDRGKMIDLKYGHLFDKVLVIESVHQALETCLTMIGRLDRDTQWVPVSWLPHTRPESSMPSHQ